MNISKIPAQNYIRKRYISLLLQPALRTLKFRKPKGICDTHIAIKFKPIHLFRKGKEPDYYYDKPVTIIDELISFEPGAGTKLIKDVVRKSLNDKTEGRVALLAGNINFKKGHSMGFYYKLGFRSISKKYNKICEKWLKDGGKLEDRPIELKIGLFTPPEMYLPKENIKHCLNYPDKNSHFYVV